MIGLTQNSRFHAAELISLWRIKNINHQPEWHAFTKSPLFTSLTWGCGTGKRVFRVKNFNFVLFCNY